MKRLKQKKGETIAETLVSILIMAIAFVIMTGAVASAARVNERIKNDETAFLIEGSKGDEDQLFNIGLCHKDVTGGSLEPAGTAPSKLYYDIAPETTDEFDPHGYYYYVFNKI